MRRLMLTTALVTFAAVPAAHAELDVTLGGYTAFQAGFFDNDLAANSDRDFQSEAEISLKASGSTDNGLKYGAYIELQTSTSDSANADEANLWLEGNWGRLELGDQDGAGSQLAVVAPGVGIGQVRGSYVDFVPAADRGYRASEGPGDPFIKALDTADATKVTYYTPRFSGFQAGASYAPERDDNADGEGVQFFNNVGDHDNAYEIGLNYKNEFDGGVKLELGAQYTGADAKTGSGLEDISAWSLGGQVGYNGFTFGGAYKSDGDSAQALGGTDNDVTGWNVGLTYESGAWGVGASYIQVDFDDNATAVEVTGATGTGGSYTAYGFGGTYKLAPGLSMGADLMFFDRDRDVGTDTDGYVLVTEVRAAF